MTGDKEKIISLLKGERSFFLVSHILPDGDSIGSLLALGEALENLGKAVEMFSPGGVPHKYRFLPGSERIRDSIGDDESCDVAIVLDSSDLERTGIFKVLQTRAAVLVNIDHHVTNQRFGAYNLVDAAASATGEIMFDLLKGMGVPLTDTIAKNLYVAIVTDTGSFKFDNTTAQTHLVAAELLPYNIQPGELSQRIFDERPLAFFVLLKEALSTLEIMGRIAAITISRDMLERCRASLEDIEGIINYSKNIEGIELGILFYVESGAEVKVGFRSKHVDVSKLAGRFNGGGHARAAGCRLQGSFPDIREKVLQEAVRLLEEAGIKDELDGRYS